MHSSKRALADTEAWLDTLDPAALASPGSDGEDLRAIGDALRTVAASDLALAEQVAGARANGRTWTQIAAVLRVTKQAATAAITVGRERRRQVTSHHQKSARSGERRAARQAQTSSGRSRTRVRSARRSRADRAS